MPSSRGSFQPEDWTCISYFSCIGRWVFTAGATWEPKTLLWELKKFHKVERLYNESLHTYYIASTDYQQIANVLYILLCPTLTYFNVNVGFSVLDAGKDWGQKKGASEDEMAGWHHQCNGCELGQTSGDDERQEGLACCSPWGCKELDMTGWLNNDNNIGFSAIPPVNTSVPVLLRNIRICC